MMTEMQPVIEVGFKRINNGEKLKNRPCSAIVKRRNLLFRLNLTCLEECGRDPLILAETTLS
jgi:hypothetical protein